MESELEVMLSTIQESPFANTNESVNSIPSDGLEAFAFPISVVSKPPQSERGVKVDSVTESPDELVSNVM